VKLNALAGDNVPLFGVCDLLVIDDETRTVRVVDYKTGFSYPTGKPTRSYERQLQFYRLLIESSAEFAGYRVLSCEDWYVEPERSDEQPRMHEPVVAAVSDEDIEYLTTLMNAAWHCIERGDFNISQFSASIQKAQAESELAAMKRPSKKAREEALQIARNAAQFLVDQSRPEGDPLAFFPPTYYKDLEASRRDWNQGKTMVLEALSAAQAFMDLFDATGEQGWYDRALAITRTYAKLQREDGSLPVKADFVTGEPVNASCAMLHPLLNWLRRLKEQYGVEEFEPMRARAFNWMREVALERFDMTGQFEDVSVLNLEPYQNLTNCTAAPYASYLLRQAAPADRDIADARDLIRLSEDQFVHWDWPENPDGFKKNWTPCVHEQYHYEMPVDNSACNVANAWLDWFDVTGDRLAFEKAKALIDSITLMQNQNNGQLPTTWEWRPAYKDRNRTYWINCSFSSIRTLLRMAEYPL
jgi:hypothetical protein